MEKEAGREAERDGKECYLSSLGLPSVTITLNCFVSAAFNSNAITTLELPCTSTVLPSYRLI